MNQIERIQVESKPVETETAQIFPIEVARSKRVERLANRNRDKARREKEYSFKRGRR